MRNQLARLMTICRVRPARWMRVASLAAFALAAGLAGAQPSNDSFANASLLTGLIGSTNGDNTLATLEGCETTVVDTPLYPSDTITNSVWFAWTASADGAMTMDTLGSTALEPVLSVWTSTNAIPTMCDGSLTNIISDDFGQITYSQVSFPVVAGTTYYIEVSSYDDGTSPNDNSGPFVLNWQASASSLASGPVQFSAATYSVSERDSQAPNAADGTTVNPSVRGARLTVTRPAPGYGRVYVDYTVTVPPVTNITTVITTVNTINTNNDYYIFNGVDYTVTSIQGQPNTNGAPFVPGVLPIATNVINVASGLTASTNTLIFDNYQLSQDILLPVVNNIGNIPGVAQLPSMTSLVTLSNPRMDPEEPSTLAPPSLGSPQQTAVSVLSTRYPSQGTNRPSILNLERSTFRVYKEVNGGNAVISVLRSGGNVDKAVSVQYAVDPTPGGGLTQYNPQNSFTLQAGSDYATPDKDFTPVNGPLSWAANDSTPKTISIPILNNGQVEFNMDFLVKLYFTSGSTHDNEVVGQVNQANVTILFDQRDGGQQPAGALDRTWNQDSVYSSDPVQIPYPGTAGNGGTVYAIAEQPDGKAIIAGSFVTYDSYQYNNIVRVLATGYRDPSFQGNYTPSFNSGASGPNSFIAALALQPDGKIIIGGNFTAYNGINRHCIARLNSDGSLDSTFNPGVGANGKIWSVALASSGQIIIGGEFSSYNGTSINRVARLNSDGSLDASFNPGVGPDDVVNAVALDASGRVVIGGIFQTVAGVYDGGVARLNVDGTVDASFTPGIGTYNPDNLAIDSVHAVAVQSDGKILIGGSFSYFDLVNYNGLVRLNTDGTIDSNFSPGSGTYNPVSGLADTIYSILIQTNGEILIGGDLTTYNQTRRVGLALLFTDGTVDTSFMDAAYNQFAGLPNRYFNEQAVATNYPFYNTRNAVYALALEAGGNVMIGGAFSEVGGGYTAQDIHPRSNVARLIGGATPGPGNIAFMDSSISVNNTAGQRYINLIRTNGNLGAASATFSVVTGASGPGVASTADFSLGNTQPTWPTAWPSYWTIGFGDYGPNFATVPVTVRTADVYVTVTNSGNITGNLNAGLTLSNPSGNFQLGGQYMSLGVALGAQASAQFTIVDVNSKPGVLGFSTSDYWVIQNGTNIAITITRTNGSDVPVSVWAATSNGTGTNGIDYTGATNLINFGIGQTTQTFTVATLGHYTTIQPDKTVNLRLFGSTGGATIGQTNATLHLINKNGTANGHLNFAQASFGTNENSGFLYVTVNRSGSSSGTLGVTVITADGTAFNHTNYTSISTNLVWNNNDATPKTIAIPVLPDHVVTPDLIANIYLTNATVNSTANGTPLTFGGTNATLTIANVDSAGQLQFSSAIYSVNKYGGYALIPVVRVGGSVGCITNIYSTLDGTAVDTVDYYKRTNTLVFTNGQVSQYFTVPVVNNGSTNPALTSLTLQLFGANLGTPNTATLNIINTEIVTDETPGSADTTFSTMAGFNNSVYALALQTDNKLLAGGDFTLADGVPRYRIARLNADGSLDAGFSLPSSTMGANASVRALAVQADGRILMGGLFTSINGANMYHIARLNSDGTRDSLFNPGSGADNTVYALAQTFVGGVSKVLLGGAFATISGSTFNGVAQLNNDGTPDTTFNAGGAGANGATVYALAVQPTDGKIIIGGDFTSFNGVTNCNHIARLNVNGTVDTTFTPGSGANASVQAIAVQLDGKILIGGSFTNVNGVARNRIARLNADGTVDTSFNPSVGADDVVYALALQSNNRIVVGGSFTACSGVTRNRITRLNPDGSVDPTINFGTGANDFVQALVIQRDTIAGFPTNVPDEKIILAGGFTKYNGAAHSHIARIFGGSIGGSGSFTFSAPDYYVDERGLNVAITVWRTGGTSNAPSGDVFVTVNASDLTAVNGINYNYTNIPPFRLDFPLGEAVRTFTIPVVDDGVVTPDLTVNLALTNATAPASVAGQTVATLHIINDDATISFSTDTYSVPKNIINGVAPITIFRNGSINGAATVNFMTTTNNGTALQGADYYPTNLVATFAPGVSNVTVNVPIINNGIPEGNRTVGLVLTNAVGAQLYNPSNATLTIIDSVNQPGQLSFSATNYVVNSSDGYAYLTVLRTNGYSGTVTVNFTNTPGSAAPGSNYLGTGGSVTLFDHDPSASATFGIQLINNPLVFQTTSFSVSLANPSLAGVTLAAPTNTTVTIVSANSGLTFQSATNYVSETNAVGLVFVQRLGRTNNVITVNYATTNSGTAVAGYNYQPASGVMTFNAGETIKAVSVPLYNRHITTNVSFGINLFGPSVGTTVVPPASALVYIQGGMCGLSFATNAVSVVKSGTNLLISVINSNPGAEPQINSTNDIPVSVYYYTTNMTAVSNIDYVSVSGTLVFTNGIGTNIISVPILNNNQLEGNRSFGVVLANPTANAVLMDPSNEVVTIVEINSGIKFSQPKYTVLKSNVVANITVLRTYYTNTTVSVNYSTANGTATAGQNYLSASGTLVFTNGEISKTFGVTILDNTKVQPDLTVYLQLANPTNATLESYPKFATLTIHDISGSFVSPSGAVLIKEGFSPANGIIDPGETNTVMFGFHASAGLSVPNLIATLIATNGVTLTNGAASVTASYGPLTVGGAAKFQPFTFIANGTNQQDIVPTFNLSNGSSNIGTAIFTFTLGTWKTVVSNNATIIVNPSGAASPYASYINLSGLAGVVVKSTLTLTNLSHNQPGQMSALVVAPNQSDTLVMSHAGAGNKITKVMLTFDDAATSMLDNTNINFNINAFGMTTNKPTQYPSSVTFP